MPLPDRTPYPEPTIAFIPTISKRGKPGQKLEPVIRKVDLKAPTKASKGKGSGRKAS